MQHLKATLTLAREDRLRSRPECDRTFLLQSLLPCPPLAAQHKEQMYSIIPSHSQLSTLLNL